MKPKLTASLVIQVIGYVLVFGTNWKIGLGMLLIHWAINIEKADAS